jgi:Flp pilus assembly protein CpaB
MGLSVGTAQGTVVSRTRRELSSRVSTGHVVMLLAGALGIMLTLTLLRSADDTRPVLVAARDLAPGTVISEASVRVTQVHVGDSVLATLFGADQLAGLRGRVVTATVQEGELVPRGAVSARDAHASTRLMSFPIPRALAVGGSLATGDRVDVLAVDHDSGRAGYILPDAEVVAVEGRSGGALSGASDDVTITLVVEPQTAPELASAIHAGTVMLVRSTGAPALRDQTPFALSGSK